MSVTVRPSRCCSQAVCLLLGASLLLLAACGGSSRGSMPSNGDPNGQTAETEDGIAVRVAPVKRESVSSLYVTSATLRADKQATVTARTRGVVRRLLVEEGARVASGEPLAVLEDDEQRIEFELASTASETTRREFERAERLHEQGLMSDEEYEGTRREATESRHAADLSELVLKRTVIRAPFDGQVVIRHLDVGATVSDGTPVFDLADLDPLYADVNVPERQIGRLTPGQSVRLIADASAERVEARIERIAPRVDASTGTVKVTVALAVAGGFRPGSFVRVEIVADTHAEAFVVPRSALVAEGRRWHVFRVDEGESRVSRLEVVPGFEEQNRVEILETVDHDTPLVPGDRVVVVGASALSDGAAILIIDRDDESQATDSASDHDEGGGVTT